MKKLLAFSILLISLSSFGTIIHCGPTLKCGGNGGVKSCQMQGGDSTYFQPAGDPDGVVRTTYYFIKGHIKDNKAGCVYEAQTNPVTEVDFSGRLGIRYTPAGDNWTEVGQHFWCTVSSTACDIEVTE